MPVAIGLDIGSSAVRAAEVSLDGSRPVIHRFGQVALPAGAVVDGEVSDVAAVADAIKRLWSEAGFKSRSVVVGLSSQRVIVRQADLPRMSREDLASALTFEAQELIPIPVEDALLDAAILPDDAPREAGAGDALEPPADPASDGPAPSATMRVLLVAAQRDMVRTHLAAVEAAGLQVEAVDLVPLAMMRAVPVEEGTGAEALVSVGNSLTHIVVRENGLPRFVRVLNTGGGDITDALARELSVDREMAETMKRHGFEGGGGVDVAERTKPVITERVDALVEEIRGSLDFFLAQSEVEQIDRVVVTGGGVRTPALLERLAEGLGQKVEMAHALKGFKPGKGSFTETQLDAAASLFVVPAGLALGHLPNAPAWGRVSLLPAEVQEARRQKRQAVMAAAAVAAFATLLGAGWFVRSQSVTSAKAKAAKAETAAASLQRQISALHEVTEVQASLKERSDSTKLVLANDVDWVRLMQQVAAVMPNDVWLTGVTLQQSADGKGAGTVAFSVSGGSHDAVARWVRQLSTLPSLQGVWVASEAKGTGTNNSVTVNFSSTATLTPAANSNRAQTVVGSTP